MATTNLLQHPSHDHPLVSWDFRLEPFFRTCDLCRRRISSEAYTCRGCESFYYHRACVEAPPQIEHHPLHPLHPLALIHGCPSFKCDACNELFKSGSSSFCCDECGFNLDICCALSTLSDPGGGEAAKQITIPLHPHPFALFSTRNDFVGDKLCVICRASIDGDGYGYMCLARYCEFVIHKRCIQDLSYADGAKAPRVYHCHPLEIFVGEDTGSSRCAYCGSDESGEFIGCPSCQVFYHRDCIRVPEILQYPPHPDHDLVLFINRPDDPKLRCGSCSDYLEGELYYHCTSCDFLVHVRCALQTISYCKEGKSVSIQWTWHEHRLLLCHKTKFGSNYCCYCGDESSGPTYTCSVRYCEFLLHERCSGVQPTMIDHPYHPQHPLTFRSKADDKTPLCKACCKTIVGFNFSCESCSFFLHSECAARVHTQKHYIHEHELLHLNEAWCWKCNRCDTSTDSPFFRCVLCNFNIHEKCIELPRVVKSEVDRHELTLHETYVEDDSGEYYCDLCEKPRDGRLGVYVCGQCSARWTYHTDCIMPELRKVYEKRSQTSVIQSINERIAIKNEEVHATEVKLEEMKRELHLLTKERDELIFGEEHYETAPEESEDDNEILFLGSEDDNGIPSLGSEDDNEIPDLASEDDNGIPSLGSEDDNEIPDLASEDDNETATPRKRDEHYKKQELSLRY